MGNVNMWELGKINSSDKFIEISVYELNFMWKWKQIHQIKAILIFRTGIFISAFINFIFVHSETESRFIAELNGCLMASAISLNKWNRLEIGHTSDSRREWN